MTDESLSRPELPLEDLRWLHALAERLVRDPHMAADAVQDTLVRALERGPRDPRSLRAWLGAVLRNVVRREWRGRERRAAREARTATADESRSTLEVIEELALHQRLVAAVHALDEPYRTAIALRFLRGRTPHEIALELGMPVKTVHSRIERGIERLRARLAPDRGAWIVLLELARPAPLAAPVAPLALLLAMKLKTIAAALLVLALGTFLYLRGARPTIAEHPPAVAEHPPEAAPRSDEQAPSSVAQREALTPVEHGAATTPHEHERAEGARALVQGFVRELDGRGVAELRVVFEREAGGAARFERMPETEPTVSGAAGAFALPLPSAAGRLSIDDARFASVIRPHLDGTLPLAPPILVVAPSRSYAGRVVDTAGNPLGGARVEITLDGSFIQSLDVGGTPVHVLLPFAEQVTDADGRFRFEHVGFVERAHLAATADGFEAGEHALPADDRDDLELALSARVRGARTIVGRVIDELGAPAAGAQVSVGGPSVATDSAGHFALEVESWRTGGELRALRRDAQPATLALDQALRARAAGDELVLRLGPAPRVIRGRVLDAAGAPVAGALVWTPDTTTFGALVHADGENSLISDVTVEAFLTARLDPWESSVHERTDGDGRFELAGVLDRAYAVFALDPRTLESAGPVELAGGEEHGVLTLAGRSKSIVAGRVLSRAGTPLAGVRVALGRSLPWRTEQEARLTQWKGIALRGASASWAFTDEALTTDAEGRFAFAAIETSGTYLALRGKAIVLGASFELDQLHDLAAPELDVLNTLASLELRVAASSRFQLALARPNEADAFGLEDEHGETAPLFLEVAGATISAGRASLEGGRSGVVLVEEGEHSFVLFQGENVVRRFRLTCPAGGLHTLTP